MSSSLEDGAARQGRKVTERPSGLDEPLVLVPSGAGLGWNAEPGAFRLPAQVPQRVDTPTGDSGIRAPLRIFKSALVGGLAAAVISSPTESTYGGIRFAEDITAASI